MMRHGDNGECYKVVLIVEDDWVEIEMMRRSLQRVRSESMLVACTSVMEATALLGEVIFDVIILDMHLDDGTAVDVLMVMSEHNVSTPTYLRSRCTDEELLDRVTALGVRNIVPKTWSVSQLDAFMRQALQSEDSSAPE